MFGGEATCLQCCSFGLISPVSGIDSWVLHGFASASFLLGPIGDFSDGSRSQCGRPTRECFTLEGAEKGSLWWQGGGAPYPRLLELG